MYSFAKHILLITQVVQLVSAVVLNAVDLQYVLDKVSFSPNVQFETPKLIKSFPMFLLLVSQ